MKIEYDNSDELVLIKDEKEYVLDIGEQQYLKKRRV